MHVWGWSGMSHDASLAVFEKQGSELDLLFAAHSERYSRVKNDKHLNTGIILDALNYSDTPSKLYYYEKSRLKKTRQLYAGQFKLLNKEHPKSYFSKVYSPTPRMKSMSHHHSHAAAGYYTSKFRDAAVLCIDSIGEWETLSIWHGNDTKLTKQFSQWYPNSVGIWYSAMTQRIGLKPQEHEYILMGMAAVGDPEKHKARIMEDFLYPFTAEPYIRFKRNLHRGCRDWAPELNTPQDYADIAAGVQAVYEIIFEKLVQSTLSIIDSKNLVIMGGCALNCVANSIANKYYDNVWIMPNPGDAGSSIGAVLAHYKTFVNWPGAYLGHNIEGKYPVACVMSALLEDKITAVAAGRAEFGPRALGHRSILADPRGDDVKDRVNKLKQRESFRPFAPMILEEYADEYFEHYNGTQSVINPYMQMTVRCKRPDLFPAIVHYDNSSRLQTVSKKDCPDVYNLLKQWHKHTGCPMLLNTSLNIKGEPLVNTRQDAERWTEQYGVKICLPK